MAAGRNRGNSAIEGLERRQLLAAIPAFPGAEGFGMLASGGRGGTVYEVINLNDSGAGSLRDAVSQSNRTIVFRVSGTINLNSTLLIAQDNITIAGQTAPGGGITLRNYALRLDGADNIIVRYIRVRPGDTGNDNQVDGIGFTNSGASNVIFDHISASWGIDENFSFYGLPNITIQWSIVSEALLNSKHPSGPHSMGGIMNGRDMTAHHNIFISNNDRNPKFNIADWWPGQNTDFRNNVIYNWGARSTWGGNGGSSLTNVVNNYYKAGPSSSNPSRLLSLEAGSPGEWYVNGNYVAGFPAVTANNWTGVANASGGGALNAIVANQQFASAPVTTQTAEDAYDSVLQYAGANVPLRDSVDTRVLSDVVSGTGALINSQTAVGGWSSLPSTAPPTDTDHDGMPDSFETANGLNINSAADRNDDPDTDGYTNLEEYLNSLVPTLGPITGPVGASQSFWPFPANGNTQEDASVQLRWKAGFNTVSERIYFGTSPNLTEADFKQEKVFSQSVVNKQLITTSFYSPGQLTNDTTYYWRIDSVNQTGTTTGQTWSFTPGLPVAGPGAGNRMEAEAMTRSRAFINTTFTEVPSEIGSVRYTFNKSSGVYRIDVRYIDEGDGAGLFQVYRNADLIGQWTADTNNDLFIIRTFNSVQLNSGDVIKVVSRRHNDELGRVDYVDTTFVSPDVIPPTVLSSQYDFEHGKVVVQFSEDVLSSLQATDAEIEPLAGGADILPSSFTYSAAARTATFSFASRLPDGNYRLRIPAGAVQDANNNLLASDYVWQDASFFVLAGDVNRNRAVDVADLGILATNWQLTGKTWSGGDFNFDGTVDVADLGDLATNWQSTLPSPAPARFGAPLAPRRKPLDSTWELVQRIT